MPRTLEELFIKQYEDLKAEYEALKEKNDINEKIINIFKAHTKMIIDEDDSFQWFDIDLSKRFNPNEYDFICNQLGLSDSVLSNES